MTHLQIFVVLGLPITGLCYATLGSIKLPLTERLGLDEAKVGGLISAFGFMVGPIILLCGALSDAYGRKPVWFAGSLLVVSAFLTFAGARRYGAAVLATVLLATGWTAMINVANPLMGTAFADPFTGNNLGDALFGAGALLCPLLVEFLRRRFGFGAGLTVIAVLAVLPFLLAFGLDMGGGELNGDLGAAFAGFAQLLSDRTVWLLGLTLLFFVVIESGTAGWATTLVRQARPSGAVAGLAGDMENAGRFAAAGNEQGYHTPPPPAAETGEIAGPAAAAAAGGTAAAGADVSDPADRVAATTLSVFWLCFMASRLLTAYILHGSKMSNERLIEVTQTLQVVIAVLAVLTMLGLVVARSRPVVIALVIFAGFICGPFFPNIIGQLITYLTGTNQMAYVGRAVGMVFACASVGWTLLPAAMGFVGRNRGVRRAFLLPAAGGVVMIVLLLMNTIMVKGPATAPTTAPAATAPAAATAHEAGPPPVGGGGPVHVGAVVPRV